MHLEAQWVVGFVDSQECFQCSCEHRSKENGLSPVTPQFVVCRNRRDIRLLYALKGFFGRGVVRIRQQHDQGIYLIKEVHDLIQTVIPFFDKHLLKTSQRVVFQKFRRIVLKMDRGERLIDEDLFFFVDQHKSR